MLSDNKFLNETMSTLFYIAVGILLAISVNSLASEILDTEYPIVTVSSGSMKPYLNVGDMVIVNGENNYSVGDVIIFDGWRNHPIIHRIVMTYDGNEIERYENFSQLSDEIILSSYVGEKIYITKGDNNSICDQCVNHGYVTYDVIHGRRIATIPYLGLLKVWAEGLKGLF